jgi:exodeoxyribonuclease VII large subunit
MAEASKPGFAPRIWQVGALCRAVADALDARFNPVAVQGEVSGFSRASSGHCYFTIKDAQGQIRCAMFRRAAGLLDFVPRDGETVEVRGRLGVYEPRGDLQLIVESLSRAGQGALFERFLQLKARLEGQGLFDPFRKRAAPAFPRGIGLVTSADAAALHDVITAIKRRAPHIPVIFAPAAVQGAQAPDQLVRALSTLYDQARAGSVEVILLVRGGGSIEDLWAFNDEQLARTIVQSPVPVICGVGHETDFTIADFCADVRAPTPTAAAELAAEAREVWMAGYDSSRQHLQRALRRRLDTAGQRLDLAASRIGRPLARMGEHQLKLGRCAHRLQSAVSARLERDTAGVEQQRQSLVRSVRKRLDTAAHALDRGHLRLNLLDPRLVLQRGYALLTNREGQPLVSKLQTYPGQQLVATLADGEVDVIVAPPDSISS